MSLIEIADGTPTKIGDLSSPIREALAYLAFFRDVLVFENPPERELSYDESTGVARYILWYKDSKLEFNTKMPLPFVKTQPGEFLSNWMLAQDLWDAATPEEKSDIIRGSIAWQRGEMLVSAINFKGIRCRVRSAWRKPRALA